MAFFPGIKRQAPGLSDMRWKRATACFPADSRLAGFTLRGTQRQRPPKGCIRNAVGTRRRGQKRFRRCHFRDSCMACGACIAYCPHGALEPDEDGKPVLIWDLCRDDFACVMVCPVAAVKRTSEAGKPPLEKWYRVRNAEARPQAEAWYHKLAAVSGG